jgi:hypothetical protein
VLRTVYYNFIIQFLTRIIQTPSFFLLLAVWVPDPDMFMQLLSVKIDNNSTSTVAR